MKQNEMLRSIEARLNETRLMRSDLKKEVQQRERDYISGAVEHTQLHQKLSELRSVEATIESLESKRSELQEELKQSQGVHTQGALVKDAVAAIHQTSRLVSEYDRMLEEASQQILNIGLQLAGKRIEISDSRRHFQRLERELSSADAGGVNFIVHGVGPDELRTVRESKIRHQQIDLSIEVKQIEAAALSRIEKGRLQVDAAL